MPCHVATAKKIAIIEMKCYANATCNFLFFHEQAAKLAAMLLLFFKVILWRQTRTEQCHS
jgi:hypothetical protein